MTEGMDLTIENLKSQLNDLKQKISLYRKKGINTKIAELKLMAIPAKIKMLEATRDLRDAQKSMKLIQDANAELEELEKESLNIDSQKMLRDEMDSLKSLLDQKKLKEAKQSYSKCANIYNSLPNESKKAVFDELDGLRQKLSMV